MCSLNLSNREKMIAYRARYQGRVPHFTYHLYIIVTFFNLIWQLLILILVLRLPLSRGCRLFWFRQQLKHVLSHPHKRLDGKLQLPVLF